MVPSSSEDTLKCILKVLKYLFFFMEKIYKTDPSVLGFARAKMYPRDH